MVFFNWLRYDVMTSVQTIQVNSDLQAQIKANLIALRENFGFSGREIAVRLGINENFVSRVYNGKSDGSRQLLAGLNLLIELETLKREREEILALKRAIQQIAKPDAAFVMNETGNNTGEADIKQPAASGQYPELSLGRRRAREFVAAAKQRIISKRDKKAGHP